MVPSGPFLAGTMQMDPGGTANLAVLGGNLPPSFGTASPPTQGGIPATMGW